MFCTRCGVELDDKTLYCSRCGNPTKLGESTANPYAAPILALDKQNKKIAGVCAGFARYFGVDVLVIRIVWVALVLGAGVGVLAYLIAWAVMPSDHGVQLTTAGPRPL